MEQKIEIKANEQELKGSYANNLMIYHSKEEFILDFINIIPPTGFLVDRIITNPASLKRISEALKTNIDNYEKQFGKISVGNEPQPNIGFKMQ